MILLPIIDWCHIDGGIEADTRIGVERCEVHADDGIGQSAIPAIGNGHEAVDSPGCPPLVFDDPIIRGVVPDQLYRVVDQR